MPLYTPQLIERARGLRKNMTPQERRLWYSFLRNHPMKFYRQRPIGGYIVDFYCHELKLVIEIDGSHHNTDEAIEYDNVRTEYMNSLGLTVMRFRNHEIDYEFSGVCEKINSKAIKK
ncbi:MAG: endonuclease domain-containing protein [Synergistaceae bacterium]|nr:endonuclease domain-containing protein [Synergistaceae bacterium]MBQ3397304.1 endonuclease domain-containing protein [Synergistaceae bacterium]MBQ3760074.1 endonuclease domain-containing protein [Synergistaceae bacterium]MBQ6983187.1 endonuclease domain-containing protein [Synergistaceae bacterium]